MKKIVSPLLEWYSKNKRELPWRKDKDPYHVWISEIMLQQTRIEAVKEYYKRFMDKVPTIEDLSKIEEDELLKLWEGLGYYNRARNLKKAAVEIMEKYQGKFPSQYEEILTLPGIGEYTAGAISSICFQKKEVAVDGNVMRVYARVCKQDIDVTDSKVKKEVGEEIRKILPDTPGDFNEAIMELGETICLPNAIPKCMECPLSKYCQAYRYHLEGELPRKILKKEKKEEQLTVFLLVWNHQIALNKRSTGLLKNLWEFPNAASFLSQEEALNWLGEGNLVKHMKKGVTNTHIFTHKKWTMKSYLIELDHPIKDYVWVSLEEIKKNYAIPTAFQPFLEYLEKDQKKNN